MVPSRFQDHNREASMTPKNAVYKCIAKDATLSVPDRRQFMKRIGGAAAATVAASVVGLPPLLELIKII